MIDGRDGSFDAFEHQDLISSICHRNTGVGADGLIILKHTEQGKLKMVYYNSDGAPSSFCGNGSRCFVKFSVSLGIVQSNENFSFQAADGMHEGLFLDDKHIRVSMLLSGEVTKFDQEVDLVNTGSPHYISWCSVLPKGDILENARAIRYSPAFAKTGINVNYVAPLSENSLAIRTYERGVENETLACGTGVTAAALSFAERRQLVDQVDIAVQAVGGDLRVRFWRKPSGEVANLELEGPARHVFSGSLSPSSNPTTL